MTEAPSRRRLPVYAVSVLIALGLVATYAADVNTPNADLPDDFRQIIPRGRIASIDDPQFVSAEHADINDDAWVFGVVIDGEARAYSLNLLNHHEIVNDEIAGVPVAAVW